MNSIEADKKLILAYGGATKVAELLGFDTKNGGVQRVANWMSRGIPSDVKLSRPDIFLPHLVDPRSRKRTTHHT